MPRATRLIPRSARLAAAVLLSCSAWGALAQDVTLRTRDGSLDLSGELRGYDGAVFRLLTEAGEVSIDAGMVTCAGAACPPPDLPLPVRVSAAPDIAARLLPPLIETFAAGRAYALATAAAAEGDATLYTLSAPDRPPLRLRVRAVRAAEAFADVIADEADLILTTREVSPDEVDLAREAGRGDLGSQGRSRIVALDAVVPLVSIAGRAPALSLGQLADILQGRAADWADIGAAPGPIALHLPEPGTGAGDLVAADFGPVTAPARRHADPAALAAAVADDPDALGIGLFSALGDAQPVVVTGPCGARIAADDLSIKTEDYPLAAPVFLYAPARRIAPPVRALIDAITAPSVQGVVRRAGFVDQFPAAIPLSAQGERLAGAILQAGDDGVDLAELQRLAGAMVGRQRLSITFRFEEGSSRLDAQSRSNVGLLARAVERGIFEGRRLVFAGFSDAQGGGVQNRRLSRQRASTVRDAVAAMTGVTEARPELQVIGFGEAMPLACDAADWGRRINRRVEVWLD